MDAPEAFRVVDHWAWKNGDGALQAQIGSLCLSAWSEYKRHSVFAALEPDLYADADAFEKFLKERPLTRSVLISPGMTWRNARDLLRLCPRISKVYGYTGWGAASILCNAVKDLTVVLGPRPPKPAQPVIGCVTESLTVKVLNPSSILWWRSLDSVVRAMPTVRTLAIEFEGSASLQDLVSHVPQSIARLKVSGTVVALNWVDGALYGVTCLELEKGAQTWTASHMAMCFPNLRKFSFDGKLPMVCLALPESLETISVARPMNLSHKSNVKSVTLSDPLNALDMYILAEDYPKLEHLRVIHSLEPGPQVFILSALEIAFPKLRSAHIHASLMMADTKRLESLDFREGLLVLHSECGIKNLKIGPLAVCVLEEGVFTNDNLRSVYYVLGFGGGPNDSLLERCTGLSTVTVRVGDLPPVFALMEMKRICDARGFVMGPQRLKRTRQFVATIRPSGIHFRCQLYAQVIGEVSEESFVVTDRPSQKEEE